MEALLGMLGTFFDLILVIFGFSLIIFFHELGHFAAARWAGIRVLAFAIGFGTAALSYRRGLGWRRGSTEPEYERLCRDAGGVRALDARGIGPTEYRLNWLPFGGYVKMLGQDDLDPSAVSAETDSYQSVPVWKRMVVISAGVVMNVVVAALLFIVVFMIGLRTEPPRIGAVAPGSPAARAVADNAATQGVAEAGLHPGDTVLSINGREPNSFNDLVLASAMGRRDTPIELAVSRPGIPAPLVFRITPEVGAQSGLMEIGVVPASTARIVSARSQADMEAFAKLAPKIGLPGVEPGMTLVRVGDNREVGSGLDLALAVRDSGGRPVQAEFAADDGRRVTVTINPQPALQLDKVRMGPREFLVLEHLLGLTPVMTVSPDGAEANDQARRKGLQDGDIFVRIGSIEYPSTTDGIAEVRRHKGRSIKLSVLRQGKVEDLTVDVSRRGTIGFAVGDTAAESTLLARAPDELVPMRADGTPRTPPAAALNLRPGARVLAVNDTPVANFADLRAALRQATLPDLRLDQDASVTLRVELPLPPQGGGRGRPVEDIAWTIPADAVSRLHDLKWTSEASSRLFLFELEQIPLKADGPLGAVWMGLQETNRVMLTTYITFARLFEGTVKVEHLKGPVGIAHLGTRIAERGLVWLLFFMALISVNLAVVNFLPLPIVDGGQFLFLLFEQVRGRPVSVAVQNVATAAGLLLIGALFLIVTYNDIANLFGG